ncbi:monocarboxylate transporter 13-like [Diadema setosum]|uniref:monocarboxylate transporter 13-like n=1 Tax=Diadema setosum TaxID=31175 RepID=UPI003B3B33A8
MAPSPNENALYECAPISGQLESWKEDASSAVFQTASIDTPMPSTSENFPSKFNMKGGQGSARVTSLLKKCWKNPKYFRWVMTMVISTLFGIILGFFCSFGTLYMYLRKDLESTAVETGWVASLGWAFGICSPIFNAIYLRFGPRKVVIVSSILCAVGILSSSFVQTIWPLYLSFSVMFGIGAGLLIAGSMNLVASYFDSDDCALPTTLPGVGCAIGMLICSPLLEMAYESYGWRMTLRCYAAFILVSGLLSSIWFKLPPSASPKSSVPESKSIDANRKEGEAVTNPGCSSSTSEKKWEEVEKKRAKQELVRDRRRKSKENYIRLLKDPAHFMLFMGTLLSNVVMVFNIINLVELISSAGYSAQKSAMFMSILSFVETGFRLLTGIFGDRLPCARILVIPVLCLICGCATFSLTISTASAVIICYVVFAGMGRAVNYSIIFAATIETFGHAVHQESFSILLVAYGIGCLLAAVIPGLSFDLTGSYDSANYCGAAMWLISAALYIGVYLLKNRQNRLRYTAIRQDEEARQAPTKVDTCQPLAIVQELTAKGVDLEGALEALNADVNDVDRIALKEYYVIVDKVSTV